jgi:uncharacterized repeat protein (TIGR01451 family)
VPPAGLIITGTATIPDPYVDPTFDNTAELRDGEDQLIDEDTASVLVLSNVLTLTKDADLTQAWEGDTVTYTLTIGNTSGGPIDGLSVVDPVIDTWNETHENITVPDAGLVIHGTATIPDGHAGLTFDNTAVLQRSADQALIAEDTASVLVLDNTLTLTKSADLTQAWPGDTINYTFTIENLTEDVTINNVTLVDPVIDSEGTWDDPLVDEPVPPGVTEITATATIPDPYTDPTFDNTAQLQRSGDNTLIAEDSFSVAVLDNALTLTKVANPTSAAVGATITYTFTITNLTGVTIDNVTLVDPLIETWAGAHVDRSVVPGASIVAGTATVAGTVGSTFDNTATLQVDGEDVTQASASVNITGTAPVLTLDKSASPTEVATGQTVTYTFTITNDTGAQVDNVTLSDPMITDMGGTWNKAVPDPLPQGETTIKATVTVPLAYDDATLDNTARLLVDGVEVDRASASVDITGLGLTLEKEASPTAVTPGQTVTYTFTITNDTGAAIPNVTLADPMITDMGGTWADTVPNPLPEGDTIITATVKVPEDYADPTLENTARLRIDGERVTDASARVRVVEPGLFVEIDQAVQVIPNPDDPDNPILILDPLPLQTGEPVQVVFTMSNTGAETITNLAYQVHLDEELITCQLVDPAALPDSLAAGESVEVICQYAPPISLDQYFETGGLTPVIQVTGTGQTSSGQLTNTDEEQITLVDLRLGVDLQFTLPAGVTPGTNVSATWARRRLAAMRRWARTRCAIWRSLRMMKVFSGTN